jgi:hypothetical protein
MTTDRQRKDERRAETLRQVARRIKHGSSLVVDDAREARRSPPAAMTDRETHRLEQLRAEASYRRQRLDLYRARLYGGRGFVEVRVDPGTGTVVWPGECRPGARHAL